MTAAEGERAAPRRLFDPLLAAGVTAAAVFAFAAGAVLNAFAPELRSGDDGQAHVLSRSAVGFAALAEALSLDGRKVEINRIAQASREGPGLLILTPPFGTGLEEIKSIAGKRATLVVLPKYVTLPNRRHGWVDLVMTLDPADAPKSALERQLNLALTTGDGALLLQRPAGPLLTTGVIHAPRVFKPGAWTPVLWDQQGRALMLRAPDRPLYVLGEPDLLNTRGLKDAGSFAAAMTLVEGLGGEGPYVFDVRMNGLNRGRSPLRLLFQPPFLGVTLALVAALILAVVQRRFGPLVPRGRAIPPGRAVLVENTAALIEMQGREAAIGRRYPDVVAARAAQAVGAPRGLSGDALAGFLDRLSRARGLPRGFSELSLDCRTAASPGRARLAAAALDAWFHSLTGASRAPRPQAPKGESPS